MQRKFIFIAAAAFVIAAGWYAFRPERLFVNQTVNESFPTVAVSSGQMQETSNAVLAAGEFHSVHHDTKGHAEILQQGGKRILRLSRFATSNGPDVRVYLVAATDATDDATVKSAGFVEIAPLKGNIGDQNYELPASLDLGKYHAVTIWCKRFSVNFGSAPLTTS